MGSTASGGRAGWLWAALAGGLVAWLVAGRGGADGEGALPPDAALVPPDGGMVVSVRVADLWSSDVVRPAREKLGKDLGEMMAELEKHLGAPLSQIERLTLLLPAFPPPGEVVLVALDRPLDRAKVKALAGEGAKEEKFKGATLFVGEGRPANAVALLGDRLYAFGPADPLRGVLDRPAREKEGPLTAARRALAARHSLVVGVNVPGLAERAAEDLPAQAEPIKPLLEATSATLVADLGADAKATLSLAFAGDKEARKGAQALRAGLDLARMGLGMAKKSAGNAALEKVVGQLDAALKDARVEQKGAAVQAAAEMKVDAATATLAVIDLAGRQRLAASRVRSQNNLRQIALAMHNFSDNTGRMPPAAIYDRSGKPLLSWRVIILPYIEQDALYKQFHLDEPWDSDHNKKLLAQIPPIYTTAGPKGPPLTHYQGFHGKGAFFEGKTGIRFPADIPDGTSNTIMIVEAADAVPWTKPQDLPYDPDKPLPKLGGLSEGGFNAAFCDGSVHFILNKVPATTLHLLIQRNDGQVIPGDF
jgi:prepilin-type processing-associated H-X9-DG protein